MKADAPAQLLLHDVRKTYRLRRGLLAPGADFLPKPFSPEALVRAVRVRTIPASS